MAGKPKISLKARALKYLSAREHSRLELSRKLGPHAADEDELRQTLDWLEEKNYLSSERFSEALVHRRASRYGNLRLLSELQQHRLDDEAMQSAAELMNQDEAGRALQVLRRKFANPPASIEEKQKQYRFLMQRGFSGKAIRAALNTSSDPDEY